jgi:uncharacterized membrane protein YkvA (DUF1232 family)
MEADQERSSDGSPTSSSLPDILAVIDSAKARGGLKALERHIARSLPDAEGSEVGEAAEVALEVIESIPVFLARARQEAQGRRLTSVVGPLLDRAEWYYLQPLDLIPEMTQGLPGLLDDSYLVIKILQNLDKGPQAFLDWDLEVPSAFLRRLIGAPVAQRLDRIAVEAMDEVSAQVVDFWDRVAHPA